MKPLDEAALTAAMTSLDGWSLEDDSLTKTFDCGDFRKAMAFLVRVAFEAEQRNHHPEVFNVYKTVQITLRTHDAGDKVTQADVDLARAIDTLA
jgi:4a-hydroxytetrahydrobiopterin dehydratase